MSVSEKPLADECSLCGLPMYHFQVDVADEPTDGEYRWAHEVCYTFSNAVERHHEKEVRNSSDEPRADGGRVPKSRPALQHRLVVDVQAFEDGGVVSLKSEWDGRRGWIVAAAETLKDQDGLLVEVETRRVHTNSRLERVPEQRPEERDLL